MLPDVRFPKESHRNSPDRLQLADQTVRLPAEVPDGLRRAVQESLNRRVEDRPHSVQEFRALIGGPPVRSVVGREVHGGVPRATGTTTNSS